MKDMAKNLSKKIRIQNKESNINENGFNENKWNDYIEVWADKNNLFGKEYWSAKALQAENTVVFTIRYCFKLEPLLKANATKLYRILQDDRCFNIIHVDNIKEDNIWIKIKATEVI